MKRNISELEKRLRQFEQGIQAQVDSVPKTPSEEALERVKHMFGGDDSGRNPKPLPPKVVIKPEIKAAVFHNVVDIVKSGANPRDIASKVVEFLESTVDDINTEAGIINETRGPVVRTSKGPKGAVFRRSE